MDSRPFGAFSGTRAFRRDWPNLPLVALSFAIVSGLSVLATAAAGSEDTSRIEVESPLSEVGEWQSFLDANCVACHSGSDPAGGLVLADRGRSSLGADPDIWEAVIRRLSAGEMPPPSVARRPDPHAQEAFLAALTEGLDAYAAANANPGRPVIRRLTRVEYNNAVRDLLNIEMDLTDDLPPDAVANGFNNNGDALAVTSLMLEKYSRAARIVSRAASGDETQARTLVEYEAPEEQRNWQQGAPLGTRGGLMLSHYFPLAGDYVIKTYIEEPANDYIEGHRVFTISSRVSAGAHDLAIVFPEESAAPEGPISNQSGIGGRKGGPLDITGLNGVQPLLDVFLDGSLMNRFEIAPPGDLYNGGGGRPGAPYVRVVTIDGPVDNQAAERTASYDSIFVCEPATARREGPCAEEILSRIVRRAYRRDVSDGEVQPFLDLYQDARERNDFHGAIQESIRAVLVSPDFLFRIEQDPESTTDLIYELNDFELASRLSFFLWSSIPDERLLDLAGSGQLSQPGVLERETLRMLEDERADALIENFGLQFLGLYDIDAHEADRVIYQDYNDALRENFVEETRLFLRSLLRSNSGVIELIGADFTFLNEDLADHYGIPGVSGPGFRKVSFAPGSVRGGILGQGSVLFATSHPDMTSPVLRGKWVLTNLFNQPPAPPPPGIPAIQGENEAGRKLTGREQMELHRTSPVCSSCHARMDPFGFAMENFDVLGVWRTSDAAGPIDAAATLPAGDSLNGIGGLKDYLMQHDEQLAQAFTQRLMIYALGRRLEGTDSAVVRDIVRDAETGGYKIKDLILAVVKSVPFQMRRKEMRR